MSKVVCKTKRIGGGFGGKETRSAFLAAVASVPSYLLNRPVKLTLDRDIDMMITGQRHSFLGKYKVLFLFVLLDNSCQNKIILLNYGAGPYTALLWHLSCMYNWRPTEDMKFVPTTCYQPFVCFFTRRHKF